LEISPAQLSVSKAGFSEKLEPRVMETLVVLARADGAVVSREALIEECWGGRAVTDDAVQRVIARLRRLSESLDGEDFSIETTPKVGYRLVAHAPVPIKEPPAQISSANAAAPAKAAAARLQPASIVIGLGAIIAAVAAGFVAFRPEATVPAPTIAAAPAADTIKKIAVLPFVVTGANAPDYLSSGVALEMSDRLGRIGGLRVIAESSAAAVAAEDLGATEIAERLNADFLVEGDVESKADEIHLRIKLVSGRDGGIEWSRSFSGPVASVGAIEAKASFALIEKLVLMLGVEALPERGPPAVDPRVYPLLMEARHAIGKGRERTHAGDRDGAQAHLVEARGAIDALLAIDPENASGLYLKSHFIFRNRPEIGVTATDARALLERAARSDPNHPGVLVLLAEEYRREGWQWDEAERLLSRALAIDPNHEFGHAYYAYLKATLGECDTAIKHAKIAGELAPHQIWFQLALPRVLKCAGDFESSRKIYFALLADQPGNVFIAREVYVNLMLWRDDAGLARLADILANADGASPATIALAPRARLGSAALRGEPETLMGLVRADAKKLEGLPPDGPQEIEGRAIDDYLYLYAVEAAAAGDADFAVELLERALTTRSLYVSETLPYGPTEFTPEVRAHPRYQALWRTDPALVDLVERRRKAFKGQRKSGSG
jgi:DNA-binding winged helix-turn-helix (wHTH) protein/TolB-like protein/tetratricopeptide (TPR) repeat protein